MKKGDIRSVSVLNKFKHFLAHHINNRVNNVSNAKKKTWLLILGMLTGFLCLYLVLQAIRSDNTSNTLSIERMPLPRTLHLPDHARPGLSLEREYNHVLRFRQLLDSLKANPDKRSIHDSIMLNRPGLADSINLFLEHYESHYSN